MPRYAILPKRNRPRAEWADDEPMLKDIETDIQEPEPTGILDASGQEVMRLPERIGFIWHREE